MNSMGVRLRLESSGYPDLGPLLLGGGHRARIQALLRPIVRLLLGWGMVLYGALNLAAATLSIGTSSAVPGGVARLPILLSGAGGAVGLQFDLQWASNTLASGGSPLATGTRHQAVASPPLFTPLRVVVYSERNEPLPEGLVVEVPLLVPTTAPPGGRPLVFSEVLVADAEGRLLPDVATRGGSVEVLSTSAPVLSDPRRVPDGGFLLTLGGLPGRAYVIETSTDLRVWVAALTNAASTATRPIVDVGAGRFPVQFYRALERP
jgi:hypothetical protein